MLTLFDPEPEPEREEEPEPEPIPCLYCPERCSRGQDRVENEGAKGE